MEIDLSKESLETQAAYHWLGQKGVALFLDWYIADDKRRLMAARKCAEIHGGIEKVLKSNWAPQ